MPKPIQKVLIFNDPDHFYKIFSIPANAGIFHSQYPCLRTCGITPSNSRPRVSNDNPYAESLFKTLKYHPNYQPKGFETLEEAREWVSLFVKWYNHDHHHSGLNFLTPYQRRSGSSDKILSKRKEVYEAAKAEHPERWNGRATRDWSLPDTVYLNPEKVHEQSEKADGQMAVS